MANWNPNSSGTLGLEWAPYNLEYVPLDSPMKAVAMSLAQTAAQVTGIIRVLVGHDAAFGASGSPVVVLDVYDNETGVATGLGTATYRPNADVSGTGALAWQEDDGTTTTIYTEIDETTYDATDYIKLPDATGTLVTSVYAGRVDNTTSLTGLRPLAVTVTAVVSRTAGYASRFRLGLDLAGTRVFSPYFTPAADQIQTITYTWNYQPVLNRPWRIADITTLLNASDEWLLEGEAKSNEARCYQAYVSVPYCTENRIASGTVALGAATTGGNAADQSFTMLTPTGGAWTKDGAGRHLYVLRRISPTGVTTVPVLRGNTLAPIASRYIPTLNPAYGYITAMGDALPDAFRLVQNTTAPAVSTDSQAFAGTTATSEQDLDYLNLNATITPAGQEFTTVGALSYSLIRVLCRPGEDVTAALTMKIKRVSDGVQFGSTETVTVTETDALPDWGPNASTHGTWKIIERVMTTPATLAAATQYKLELTSAAPGATAALSWNIANATAVVAGDGLATFNGTTDEGINNGGRVAAYDLYATISTQPTAPANFAVALSRQTLPTDGMTGGCHVDHIDYAHLTWTATALGASFDYYTIQRTEDAGVTWTSIAQIETEATSSFDDYEGKRDATTQYRIRVVRTDLSFSAWSTSGGIDPQAVGCELIFTSNENPAYNCAHQRSGPLVYQFIDAGERVLRRPYGRDRQLAFIPTERRGTTFETILTVYASDTAPAAGSRGLPAFDRLRALSVLDVPYVCVLDPDGNRLFANVTVNDGTQDIDQKSLYTASVTVTEVDTEPAVVVT